MRILIATGIYPPQIGGPAQYAKNLAEEFKRQGHEVSVATYGIENKLPTGIRHLFFFFRVLFVLPKNDLCIAFDTFSVGLPATLACRILKKKIIIRTGGDFLWEAYVERTGKSVLFGNFYSSGQNDLTQKEKIIFKLTKWTLQKADTLVFSTEWQKNIWAPAYEFDQKKTAIIENFYGPKIPSFPAEKKNFISGTRPLKWKNIPLLRKAFAQAQEKAPEIILDEENLPYEKFLQKMQNSYAVILVSLGDISPNMILDAIRCGKPFILTKETGFYEKLKDIGIFVDPLDENDIAEKMASLSENFVYAVYKKKVELFNFTHTWKEIVKEFLALA